MILQEQVRLTDQYQLFQEQILLLLFHPECGNVFTKGSSALAASAEVDISVMPLACRLPAEVITMDDIIRTEKAIPTATSIRIIFTSFFVILGFP